MAAVLSSEDSNYFAASSLRRSPSQTKFEAPSYRRSIPATYDPSSKSSSDSDPSSAPSSPRTTHVESTDLSSASTPASNLSIASDFDEALPIDEAPEDHFSLPPYPDGKLYMQQPLHFRENLEPPPSRLADSYSDSPADQDSSESTSRPDTPELADHAEDDTAVTSRPSRQVDYLSHNWREEDIWTSWRYIVTRRGEFTNSARLENASWRTWMKAKNNLKTISPESLNWLKDCDVTWLYGPLQPKAGHVYGSTTEPSSSTLSKTDSLVNLQKKPILKKRSMSEVMLQRSILSASLLKQATAAVHAQETRGILTNKPKAIDDYVALPLSSRQLSVASSSTVESTDSSGITSPYTERKHIHFNEQVEQCIAVEAKGEEDDMDRFEYEDDDSDTSDDGVMMKRVQAKKRAPRKSAMKRGGCESRTIAKLPSTKLKYREDTPDLPETAMKHSRSPILSPSSSQETLRPTKQSNRFYFGEEDDDDTDDISVTGAGWRSPPVEGLPRSTSSNSLLEEPAGMRRTPSGMFMPYEDMEGVQGDGLIGRVIDTVNTARDIAHVIWNVGWRK